MIFVFINSLLGPVSPHLHVAFSPKKQIVLIKYITSMLKYFTERIRFGENGGIQHEVGHHQDEEVDQYIEGEAV